MDNRLEEKWDMLDEKEQRMIVSYMNNFLSSPDKSVLSLEDSPARKKTVANAGGAPVRVLPNERFEDMEKFSDNDMEPRKQIEAKEPVAEPKPVHKEANPGPLGLLGFGMTTVLLNLVNAGIIQMSVVVIAMGIALGGLAQIIAGLMEFKNNNTFGATAFTAYGLFWWSLVIILINPESFGVGAATHAGLGFYMLLWGIFTAFMYIGTLKMAKAQRVIFASLTALFFLLAVENFTGYAGVTVVAGVVGIFCGASAIYTAVVSVINEIYGKEVMPL